MVMFEFTEELLEKKGSATYEEIFDSLFKECEKIWEQDYADKKMNKIIEFKKGELYTMLTTSGNFIRTPENKWSLTKNFSFDEIQAYKTNIDEIDNED